MDPDAPLDYMLDGPPASREDLEAIVARSGYRKSRITAAWMAGALLVGAAVGWTVSPGHSSGGTTSVAAGRGETSTTVAPLFAPEPGGAITGGAVAGGAGRIVPLFTTTKKFVRTTGDGVTIRGYQETFRAEATSYCGKPASPGFVAEVSTSDVVGTVHDGFPGPPVTSPFLSVVTSEIGTLEGSPVWVVTTRTEAAVAKVLMLIGTATPSDLVALADQMAPVDGWAALADLAPKQQATLKGEVRAFDASGKLIGTAPVGPSGNPAPGKVLPPAGNASPSSPILPPPAFSRGASSGGAASTVIASPPPPVSKPSGGPGPALVPTTIPCGAIGGPPGVPLPPIAATTVPHG